MSGLGLTFLRRGNLAHPTAGSDYIKFADEAVFNILVSKGVSSDGVGITKDDAAKVTSVGTWFQGNKVITAFPEFQYFTSCTSLAQYAFDGCTSLQSIDLSNMKSIDVYAFAGCSQLREIGSLANLVTLGGAAFRECSSLSGEIYMPLLEGSIANTTFRGTIITKVLSLGKITKLEFTRAYPGEYNAYPPFYQIGTLEELVLPETLQSMSNQIFDGCSALKVVKCLAVTPPTIGGNVFRGSSCPIYVPDASVDAYKAAANWSTYASRIKPLSEYQG